MRVAYNDEDDRAGLRVIHTHTHTHVVSIIDLPMGGSMRVAYND